MKTKIKPCTLIAGSAFLFAVPPAVVVSYDLSTTKVQYVVGVSHLDTQYKWTVKRTIDRFIPATMRENFALFEKYPDYVFSFEGSFRYMKMKEHYPPEYEELKQWVAKGNWAIAGSMVDAPDVNVPCPESLIRQILYGNIFFEDEFDKKSIDIFLPDCFGFTYALPSIAAHCGLKGFSTCKLDWGSAREIPFDLGVWEGPDGNSVVAALKPGKYNSQQWHIRDDAISRLGESSNVWAAYGYFGVGDQGGAVDEQYVQSLCERMNRNDREDIKVISVSSDQLFRDITDEQVARLPVYKGELLMKTHGVGTYSHHADIKWRNHEAEQKAMAAERVAAAAQWASNGSYSYPSDDLKESWIQFLWHQMHDDLTGTAIAEAYTFTRPGMDSAIAHFSDIAEKALAALAEQMDTRVVSNERIPVVVFNTVGRDRVDVAEVALSFPGSAPAAVRVYDSAGEEVPSQVVSSSGAMLTVAFPARVPSCGAAVYHVAPAPAPASYDTDLSAGETRLENDSYLVTIDARGDIASIVDKRLGNKELLSTPIRLEFRPDVPDRYAMWEIKYADVAASPTGYVDGSPEITVIESGPVRATLQVKRTGGGASFTQLYRLCGAEAGPYLEVHTTIDWKERGQLLKAAFPLTASNETATFDLGIGVIARPNMTENLYEVPAQKWADLTNSDGSFGTAILTDYKRGWNKPGNSQLNLTLIHSPDREQDGDVFLHPTTRFAVCGHSGDWREGNVVYQAKRLNQPLRAVQTTAHEGRLGRSFSLVKPSGNCALMAVKKAERSDDLIVRVREIMGRDGPAHCIFGSNITAAREVNGQEEYIGAASFGGNNLSFSATGFEPRSFAVSLSDGPVARRGSRVVGIAAMTGGVRLCPVRRGAVFAAVSGGEYTIGISDVSGRQVDTFVLNGNTGRVVRLPAAGVYCATVRQGARRWVEHFVTQ